jgi:hypothetical protein
LYESLPGLKRLSIEDWHNIKAEQNAHNEILAFLMMIVGVNLLMGGLIVTVMTVGVPIINPFNIQQVLSYSSILGLILTISGFSIISAGFILVIHYDRKRTWHLKEIEKTTALKNRKIHIRSAEQILDELVYEEKKD